MPELPHQDFDLFGRRVGRMAVYDLVVDFLLDADAVGTGEPDDHCGGCGWGGEEGRGQIGC